MRVQPGEDFVRFASFEIEQSIPERFEAQVRLHGDRIAIRNGRESLSYAALNRASNRVARAILSRDDDRNAPVALLLEHGVSPVVAILGILKAGKAYVTLDPSYPESRLAYILEDSGAERVLSGGAAVPLAVRLAKDPARLLDLGEIDPGSDAADVGRPIGPDALAYILYTSGSTGQPKGVVQTHRNLLHAIMKYTNALCIGPSDRVTLLPSCSTSAAVSDVFGTLLNGASLHPYDVRARGTEEIAHWLTRDAITLYHSVPSLFRHFARELRGDPGFALRLIKLGGEPTYRSDWELFRRSFPADCLLYVALGATEIHNIRHFFIDRGADFSGNVLPVGYAFEDTEVLILDEAGAPVDPGAIGEIAVQSAYLSPGYWRRPELTARAFRVAEGGERVYRTGDLGRLRPDGCLEVVGRKDFQVKIRGFRVELGEIESVLRQQPAVADAAVVARERDAGDKQLVAYCVTAAGSMDETGLRRVLRDRLPDYMVPAVFVRLDRLPRTPNGKVDRLALPEPGPRRVESEPGFVPPRDAMEERVAGIWKRVLGVERVGARDDFFELGGHSLMALRVCLELEKALGRRIPAAMVFGATTLEDLARRLDEGDVPVTGSSLVPLQTGGSRAPFFFLAGPANHFGARLGPDQPVYLVQIQDLDRKQYFTRAEDMAEHCIQAMRSVQPRGPYYLGGHCFGGVVAFEVARRLTEREEGVALLALFDSRVRGSTAVDRERSAVGRLRARAGHRLQRLRTEGARVELESLSRSLRRKTREAIWRSAWSAGLQLGPLAPSRDPRAANYRARTSYVPRAYPGRVTLFRATQRGAWKRDDPLHGWGDLARAGVEVHDVPSGHTRMYKEPDVGFVVGRLRACLDEARAAAAGTPARICRGPVRQDRRDELGARDATRKAIAVSLHKSGTNLLTRLFEAMGYTPLGAGVSESYESILARIDASSPRFARFADDRPSILADSSALLELCFGEFGSGTCVFLHGLDENAVPESSPFQAAPLVFNYRDPRAVLVSFVHYLTAGARDDFTRISGYVELSEMLKRLPTLEERLMFVMEFVPNYLKGAFLENAWLLRDPRAVCVSYEALVGTRGGGSDEQQLSAVARLMEHLGVRGEARAIADRLYDTSSRTFRKGSVRSWQDEFSPRVAKTFDEKYGEILDLYGYEA